MKNKLTVNSIAKNNLLKRKRQYVLLILGIILSMVFSSSVIFFLSCMQTSLEVSSKHLCGAQDAIYFDANESIMKQGIADGVIGEYGFAHIIGNGFTESGGKDHTYSIGYLDEKAKELSFQSFIEGRYPITENEIAMEKSTLIRLAPDAKIGDEIVLTVHSQNGADLMQQAQTKKYTLVGIARNKKANIEFDIEMLGMAEMLPTVFVNNENKTELGGKEFLISYFTNANEDVNLYDYADENNRFIIDNVLDNNMTSYFLNEVSRTITENLIFVIIFVFILLIASSMGIINAFNSNLNDRKKQIGMLRTVGATKTQIIRIFGREAFFISIISAPVSIFISYFLVFGVSKILGDNFEFVPNWWVLVACAVFGVICVMAASLIPLFRAAHISPMQAIRNIEYTRKIKNKKIKTRKSFNAPILLAKRSIAFNKLRQIIICTILVVTIVFSCYGFSFASSMIKEGNPYYLAYDYVVFPNGVISRGGDSIYCDYINFTERENGFTDDDLLKVHSLPYVESAQGAQKCDAFMLFDNKTDYFMGIFSDDYYSFKNKFELNENNIDEFINYAYNYSVEAIKNQYGYSKELLPSGIEAYSPILFEQMKDYVLEGEINIDKINAGEEIILYAPQQIAYRYEKDDYGDVRLAVYTDNRINQNESYFKLAEKEVKAGDKVTFSVLTADSISSDKDFPDHCVRTDKEVTVGAIISELPGRFHDELMIGIHKDIKAITSLSAMKQFSPYEEYCNLNINLKENIDEKYYIEMQDFLEDLSADVNCAEIRSIYNYNQENQRFVNSILFTVISVVVLLMSICTSMINNTLSAQIRQSKRAIGTLRAVGATAETLVKSYVRRFLSTLLWSCAIGFAVYIVTFIIQVLYIKSHNEQPWLIFSLWQTIIACIILFAVCSSNLWFKIRKEMKNSIIDNIREL